MKLEILVAFIGLWSIAGQVFFAHRDSFLTVAEMRSRGLKQGIPLLYHAGIWGDLIILTPLLSIIVGAYGHQWSLREIAISSAIALVSTLIMGLWWIQNAKIGLPEAHTHGGKMTAAGFLHGVYMAAAIAIIVLFFFFSEISRNAAIVVSIVLAVHLIYGTHMVLGLVGPSWYPDRPHKNFIVWVMVLFLWALLAWRCLIIH